MVKGYIRPHRRKKPSGGFTDVVGHYRNITKPVKKAIPTRMDDKLLNIPPDVVKDITEWKGLQKEIGKVDDRLEKANELKSKGMYWLDTDKLNKQSTQLSRKMFKIQTRIENKGYELIDLV